MNTQQLVKETGDTFYASFVDINRLIALQSDICPGTTAEEWIRFSKDTFVQWFNRETGLYWDQMYLYFDGIEVAQQNA